MASSSRMLFSSSTTRTRASFMSSSFRTICSSAPGAVRRREDEDECGALSHATAHLDRAAVLLDDAIDQGEANAAPFRLGGEERLEDVGEISFRDALAAVADRDLQPTRALAQVPGADPELPAVGHRLDRVQAEIPDRLAEPLGIRPGGQRIAVLASDLEIRGQTPVLDKEQDFVQDLGHVDLDGRHGSRPRVFEEIADDLVQASRLAQHDLDQLAASGIRG